MKNESTVSPLGKKSLGAFIKSRKSAISECSHVKEQFQQTIRLFDIFLFVIIILGEAASGCKGPADWSKEYCAKGVYYGCHKKEDKDEDGSGWWGT